MRELVEVLNGIFKDLFVVTLIGDLCVIVRVLGSSDLRSVALCCPQDFCFTVW